MNANSGYVGWSKSVRAEIAENEGKLPLSRAVKIVAAAAGITQREARRVLESMGPCEWHHTSKKFNRTDFYDCELAIERAVNPVVELDDEMFDNGAPCFLLWSTKRAQAEGRQPLSANDGIEFRYDEIRRANTTANYARHREGIALLFARSK